MINTKLKSVVLKVFLFAVLFTAQEIHGQCVVHGRITDQQDNPLEGAAIMVRAHSLGTATDEKGRFQLELEVGKTYQLEVSYLGFDTQVQTIRLKENCNHSDFSFALREKGMDLQSLTVSATRADERTPMTFTNLSKQALEKRNLGLDVPFLLRWTPSAVVTSDAGAGVGYTGIRIRGTDPTRINVTINGIPINDAESQGVFWVNMPDFMSSVKDVQIQRGVGSSTNGAGAFGATLNLNTGSPPGTPLARSSASVGSFNTFKRNVQFGTGLIEDRFSVEGRLSRITSDGYIDRATSDLDSWYIAAAMQNPKNVIRFNTFSGHEVTYQAWYGVSTDLLDDRETRTFNPAGTEKNGEPYENEVDDYRQTHYQLHFSQTISPTVNGNISLHYTQGAGFFEQYKADQNFEDYGLAPVMVEDSLLTPDLVRRLWLDNDFYGAVYNVNFNKKRWALTLGGGMHIYEGKHFGEVIWAEVASDLEPGDRYYENDARKGDFNIFSKVNYDLEADLNAYLDLQYRRVDYDFLGNDLNGTDVEQCDQLHFFNPKIGLLWQIHPNTQAYASFAIANREPNRNDYVESTPASRPRPETLYNTEVGFRWTGGRAALEINAYHMYYRDQLALNGQVNDVGAYTRVNIDDSYRLGLEFSGGWQLNDLLRIDGNATFSRNKVDRFLEFVDQYDEQFNYIGQTAVEHENTDLSFSPNVITAIGLTYEPFKKAGWFKKQDLGLELQAKYVSRQFIDNTSDLENSIDPYSFTDLRIAYGIDAGFLKRIELTFLVQNLFDGLYETNAYSYRYEFGGSTLVDQAFFPQATRNFLLGLTIDL